MIFSGVHVAQSLVFCVLLCQPLFVLLYFFFWPVCCLFFFDIQILITPLVSSNSSHLITTTCLSLFSFLYLLIVLSVYITFLLPWFYHFLLIFYITSWYLLTFHSNRFKIRQMVNIV